MPSPDASTPLLSLEIINYLENKGYTSEGTVAKMRFRHPQRPSRVVTVIRTGPIASKLTFTHPLPAFAAKWQLSAAGDLPRGKSRQEIREVLDDFFRITPKTPPAGAVPFEERLPEVLDIINRIALRNQRANHYELGYDDLVATCKIKAYECWQLYGDKPTYEFQSLVSKSCQHKVDSLLSKHYKSKRRAGAETVQFAPEMADLIPEERVIDRLEHADRNGFIERLSPAQQIILHTILEDEEGLSLRERAILKALRRTLQINLLRYARVKAQSPKSRLPEPRWQLKKIALVSGFSLESLREALSSVKTLIDPKRFADWKSLFEEVK